MTNEHTVGDAPGQNGEPIEVHVSELSHLFNAMDPSPLPERDLDLRAEEFIVSWARSLRRDARLSLHVYLDRPRVSDQVDAARDAIRESFRQRSLSASRRLSQLFRVGRTSLLIGVVFLAVAVILAGLVDRVMSGGQTGLSFAEAW